MNKHFKIDGMTCASCTSLIEKEAAKLNGVLKINVSFASEKASLEVENQFQESDFSALLDNLGYKLVKENEVLIDNSLRESIILLLIGSLFMLIMFLPINLMQFHSLINLFEILTSAILILIFGRHYFFNLYRFVRFFNSDMHTLIALGIFSSLIYSIIIFTINSHSHLYVESIPFIMGFTRLGSFFEKKAKTKALTSFDTLYKSQIKFCKKVVDGNVQNFPVIEIKLNDIIRVLPGEKIPLNGVVIKGNSHIDESFINGESRPIAVGANSVTSAGAINLEGTIDLKVTALFHETSVAEIIHKLESVEKNKSEIELYTQKIVSKFVPVILMISLLTLVGHLVLGHGLYIAMKYFLTVLVIACPCALGLASPMGVVLSTRKAFEKGLLINGGDVLEKAEKINTIIFDKTGTLTVGKPSVKKVEISSPIISEEFYQLVGSVTSLSTHPLSKAISEFVSLKKVKLIDPDKFKNLPGLGIVAEILLSEVLIGNDKLMNENKISIPTDLEIGSRVFIAINGKFAGHFLIEDQAKPEALEVINQLTKKNYDIWMLTGDNQEVAEKIANELGIKNYKSNVNPIEKNSFIDELRKQGKVIAMLGDGINDTIALKNADLSMAMSNGADIAISVGEVSILDGKLNLILDFFNISKEGMKIIRQNLFFSFIYNLVCIPMAMGMLPLELDPKWASLSMGLSSLSVIINSMRIKRD